MKKLLLGFAIASVFASCGAQGGGTPKTDTDSLAYAIGVDIANMAKGFDSTLNADMVAAAVKDVFAKKSKMTQEEARNFLNYYMTVGLGKKNEKASNDFIAEAAKGANAKTTESGLVYEIIEAGSDVKPMATDTVVAHYKGTLPNGTVFDSSFDRGEPAEFPLNGVIKGWTEGLQLIGEGGKVTLYIPWELAYGEQGAGGVIGPKQSLKFEVELQKVKKGAAAAAPAK